MGRRVLADVLHQLPLPDFAAVHVAFCVQGDAFCRARAGVPAFAPQSASATIAIADAFNTDLMASSLCKWELNRS